MRIICKCFFRDPDDRLIFPHIIIVSILYAEAGRDRDIGRIFSVRVISVAHDAVKIIDPFSVLQTAVCEISVIVHNNDITLCIRHADFDFLTVHKPDRQLLFTCECFLAAQQEILIFDIDAFFVVVADQSADLLDGHQMLISELDTLHIRHIQKHTAVHDPQLRDQLAQQDLAFTGDAVVGPFIMEVNGERKHRQAVGGEYGRLIISGISSQIFDPGINIIDSNVIRRYVSRVSGGIEILDHVVLKR